MRTCKCTEGYRFENACIICGEYWDYKTLNGYISELKETMEGLKNAQEKTECKHEYNDFSNKYCLVREIVFQLEHLDET